jgi:hypothetical protein
VLLILGVPCLLGFAFDADAASPGARWGHALVYFPPANGFLLFGGARERGTYLKDTWFWNGETWQRLDVDGPPARGFSAATYHPERQSILLHGGRGNEQVTNSDLWEWDGAAWQLLDSDSTHKADHHRMVYLTDEDCVLVYGGWTGDGVSGETWSWDGDWALLADANDSPPARAAFGMTYNESRSRVELYGGLWINGQYADAWAWKDGLWQKLSGPYDNSSLDHHEMFFDSETGETLIFGGKDYRRTMRGETQRLSAAGLVSVVAGEGPGPRHSVGLAYDEEGGRALLYGGKVYDGEQQLPLGDMWLRDGTGWREIQSQPMEQ